MGHMGGLINPRPGRGQYRAGFSNTGGSPKPRKRAPCQKKNKKKNMDSFDGESKHIQKAETTIYTDGSKTDHGVGAGFVIYHKNRRIHTESIHMPDTSTVFQAEIEAISHACQYALANLKELNIRYIKILSDSQATIKALNKPRLTSQSVLTTL